LPPEQFVRVALVERGEVSRRAEVGEQQEAVLQVLRQHARCVQACLVQQGSDTHERPRVLLRRRGVHGDRSAPARPRASRRK